MAALPARLAGRPCAAPKPRKRPSGRAAAIGAAAVAAVLVAAAVVAALATRGGGGLAAIAANNVGLLDPETGRIERQIAVGTEPVAVASAARTLWVANKGGQSVSRVDERTGRATTISVGGHPTALVADRRGAWVLEGPDRRLVRVSAEFGRVTRSIPVDTGGGGAIAQGGGALWTTGAGGRVDERDPTTGAARRSWSLDGGADLLAYGARTLWVGGRNVVTPLDPQAGPLQPVALLATPHALAADARSVWAAVPQTAGWRLQQVDAASQAAVGSWPTGSNVRGSPPQTEWLGRRIAPTARSHASTRTRRATTTRRVGATPTALVVDSQGLWVAAS